MTSFSLTNFFTQICEEINGRTEHDIIIHYNNLELHTEKNIKNLFENLRDFFQIEGVHFVFVGNLTVKGYLHSIPRFSSILTDTPINVGAFTFDEINEIITKRFEIMRIKDLEYVIPFTPDCLTMLYNLLGGNIRQILNSLSTAVTELTTEKAVIIDENLLIKTLKSVLEKRYYSKINTRAKDVLMEIVKRDEITNKSISEKLNMESSNVSTYIKHLEATGCVYLRRKNGKDKFWSADPALKWALLKEKPTVQRTIATFP